MSWRTNRLALLARDVGRILGLNRWIALWLNGRGYETRYDGAFSAALHPGDTVWDVGANVGYYTLQFAERVGGRGRVFAFEPSPVNFARLSVACAGLDNVLLRQMGLGSEAATLALVQGADELGATSRVVGNPGGSASSAPLEGEKTLVEIRTGQGLIQSGDALAPNVIKIDVEGFEWEVLEGMGAQLASSSLRAIGVEMHFGILKQRGLADAPQRIEDLLVRNGFRLQWPDNSHLLAIRPAA